jgi:peptidoglycan/LPS O-acetylase OafA/YrhL
MWLGWPLHGFVNVGYILIAILVSIASYKFIELPARMFIRSWFASKDRKSVERHQTSTQLPGSISSE